MTTTVPAIRREILVDAQPDAAFRVFTQGIGSWWPVATHSVYGADATVSFEDRQIVDDLRPAKLLCGGPSRRGIRRSCSPSRGIRVRRRTVHHRCGVSDDATWVALLHRPGADRFDEARDLATTADKSVASGFFTVQVRAWQVMLQGD